MGQSPVTGDEPSGPDAPAPAAPAVSVVVPTFQEAECVATLIRRLDEVRERSGLDLELVIVDDDSPDGTAAAAHRLEAPWVHVVERRAPRSLTGAVLDGFGVARGDVLVVMDADLTHAPESVPDLIAAVEAGAPMAIGSRHVPGATMDTDWPWWRRAVSACATALAWPIARTSDPLSGFFAVRREALAAAGSIHTRGFKLALEIIVRARVRPAEIPIHFAQRRRGRSKASAREARRFLAQLASLYAFAIRRRLRGSRGKR